MPNSHPENTHHLTQFGPDNEDDVINLGELLSIVMDGKWLILAITVFVFLLGIGKVFIDTPIYKVDAMLQVNEKSQSMVGVEPLTDMFGTKLPVMAEIELIKSRKVLGAVINNLELEVIAKPKFFPFAGEAIARRFAQHNPDNTVSSPLFGQSEYAWGGEAIQVGTLAVPDALRDKEFTLLAGNQGQFQLIFNDELIAEGEVGKPVNRQIGDHQQPIHLFVSLLKARPGTQFTLIRQSSNNAILQLRDNLTVSEKGNLS